MSVAALFCFPINDIKKVMGKKPKLEEILQSNIFMLEIKLEPEILKKMDIT